MVIGAFALGADASGAAAFVIPPVSPGASDVGRDLEQAARTIAADISNIKLSATTDLLRILGSPEIE
jgi:hypothetical protein